MTDTRYPVSGSIRAWWTPLNGFANPKAPTEAEMAASLDVSDAVSWNDKDFGVQASNTNADPAITAKGNTQDRGAAQYGGGLSFYYPRDDADLTNLYATVMRAIELPGTGGYLSVRVDGLEIGTDAGTANNPGKLAKAGDMLNVAKVETAGYAEAITGEEAFRYTVSFLPKGMLAPWSVVRTAATAVAPSLVPLTLGGAVDGVGMVNGKLIGRNYTRGLELKSSDQTVATVDRNGVVEYVGAGTADVTATDPATGLTSAPCVVTVA